VTRCSVCITRTLTELLVFCGVLGLCIVVVLLPCRVQPCTQLDSCKYDVKKECRSPNIWDHNPSTRRTSQHISLDGRWRVSSCCCEQILFICSSHSVFTC